MPRSNILNIDYRSRSTVAYDCETGAAFSYRQLGNEVRRIAGALKSRQKALVCCFCRNDFETLCGYLGALEAGHTAILLDPDSVRQRGLIDTYRPDYILQSSRSPTEYPGYEMVDSVGPRIWRLPHPEEDVEMNPDLALMLTTSGSTGTAKFVRLTNANILANAQAICQGLNIQSDQRAITSLPFYYSYGLSVIHSHLLAGATLVITPESITSRQFWDACREFGCTSFAGVPYSYQLLHRLDLPNAGIPSVRTMTQAGGHLPPNLVEHNHRLMQQRKGQFFVMYGQTEATARICILPPADLPAKLGSVGKPILGGELSIDGGTVLYKGPNVMLGYAETRADLARGDELKGSLSTGDKGHLDGDGFLYITGRMTRFAKISGLRINLDEVESLLKPHGPAAVISSGEKLLIFCEAAQNNEFVSRREALARELSLHYQLLDVRAVAALPLKPNGKIDYHVLEQTAGRC